MTSFGFNFNFDYGNLKLDNLLMDTHNYEGSDIEGAKSTEGSNYGGNSSSGYNGNNMSSIETMDLSAEVEDKNSNANINLNSNSSNTNFNPNNNNSNANISNNQINVSSNANINGNNTNNSSNINIDTSNISNSGQNPTMNDSSTNNTTQNSSSINIDTSSSANSNNVSNSSSSNINNGTNSMNQGNGVNFDVGNMNNSSNSNSNTNIEVSQNSNSSVNSGTMSSGSGIGNSMGNGNNFNNQQNDFGNIDVDIDMNMQESSNNPNNITGSTVTITSVDTSGNPIEIEVDIDEYIKYLELFGFTTTDINRVINGEISPEQLMEEIANDSKDERRRQLMESSYLQACNLEFSSMDDLEKAIVENQKNLKSLIEDRNETDNREVDAILKIINRLQQGENLEDIINSEVVAYKYTDEFGNVHYEYDDLHMPEKYAGTEYEVVYFNELYGESASYKELEALLQESIINPIFGESYTVHRWAETTELVAYSDNLYKEFSSNLETRKAEVSKLDEQIAKIQEEQMNYQYIYDYINEEVDYYLNNIDAYQRNEDFDINNSFNDSSLSILDLIREKSTNNSVNYNPDVTTANSYNSYMNGSNIPNVNLEERTQIVDVISCIINGQATMSGSYMSIDGIPYQITSSDSILRHFARWSPFINESEVEVFNYIYNTEGAEAAYNYLENISEQLDNRWLANQTREDQEFASEHPWIASIASIVVTPFEGLSAVSYSLNSYFNNEKIRRVDVYSAGDIWRGQVSLDIAENHGETLAFLYSTGMSMADTATLIGLNIATGGMATTVLSATLMGSRAYVSTLNDALDRGISDGKAIALAFSSAVVETAMESYSVGHLLNLESTLAKKTSSLIKNIPNLVPNKKLALITEQLTYVFAGAISQGLCEGEEEFATEILNFVFDNLISGDLSNYAIAIDNYMGLGYSEEVAYKMATVDFAGQLKQAFLGGFVSGVCFGTFSSAKSTYKVSKNISTDIKTEFEGTKAQAFAEGIEQIRIEQELLEELQLQERELKISKLKERLANNLKINTQITLDNDANIESIERNVEYLNNLTDVNTKKTLYLEDRNELARKLNISKEEAQLMLDNKIKEIINDSVIVKREDISGLLGILKTGKMKNLFENKTGKGSTDFNYRKNGENYIFGISEHIKESDRPIYGMAMPNYEPTNSNIVSYYSNMGSNYGDVIIVLKKDMVINNSTFTCGDSLEYMNQIAASDLSNPTYNGSAFGNIFSNINFDNLTDFDRQWDNISLLNTFNEGKNYLEVQIHGETNHSIDIIDKVIFTTEPDAKLVKLLKKNGIGWEVLPSTISSINEIEQVNETLVSPLKINEEIAEIIVVSKLDFSNVSNFSKTPNLNQSYQNYDYVLKVKSDLISLKNEILNNNDGSNILIEIPNLEELNLDILEGLPDNVNIRISDYNMDFYKTYKSPLSAIATLEHLTYSVGELKAIIKEINIIKNGIDSSWNQYQIANYVYNYLKDNIRYEANPGSNVGRQKQFNGLMSLVNKESTCQGFAHTYSMILNHLGIKTAEVWGKLNGEGQHAYNIVSIDNNNFIVDTTRESLEINSPGKYEGTGFGVQNVPQYNALCNIELYNSLNSSIDSLSIQLKDNIDNIIYSSNEDSITLKMKELIAEISNDNLQEFSNLVEKIRKCTNETLPDGYDNVTDYKKDFIKMLIDTGKINDLNNRYILLLTIDPIMHAELIGTNNLNNLYLKNLKESPELLVPNLSLLEVSDFNRLFDSPQMKEYIDSLTPKKLGNILKHFKQTETSNVSWLVNDTIINKIIDMNVSDFYSFLNGLGYYVTEIKNYIKSGNDSSNYLKLLEAIETKFYTKEIILNNISYKDKIDYILADNTNNNNVKEQVDKIKSIKKEIQNAVVDAFCTSSDINLKVTPFNVGIPVDSNYEYYNLTLEIDGQLETISVQQYSGFISLTYLLINHNYYASKVLEGSLKIKELNVDHKKSNVVLTETMGLKPGLNEVIFLLDGIEKKIVVNFENSTLDLNNYNIKDFKNVKEIQMKSVKSIGSMNIEVDDISALYKVSYEIDGKENYTYIKTETPSFLSEVSENTLDINNFIFKNNLVGIKIVSVSKVSLEQIKENFPLIEEYKASTDIYKTSKYGGNQSDVSNLITSYLKSEKLSSIDMKKAELLNSLIDKYFPNSTDIQKENIATHYAKGGCYWMAVANAFATYMGSIEDGTTIFKNKIGFDLTITDGQNISYNLEAIAFDMYLSYFSKVNNGSAEQLLNSNEDAGVAQITFKERIVSYFTNRGINIVSHIDNIRQTEKNLDNELFKRILNNKEGFSILTATNFDLKLIDQIKNDEGNLDKALANSKTEGDIRRGVGGHAMLVTGIDENMNLIVSSWSKKYQFLSNSISEYKSKGQKSNASIWTIKFSIQKENTTETSTNISGTNTETYNANFADIVGDSITINNSLDNLNLDYYINRLKEGLVAMENKYSAQYGSGVALFNLQVYINTGNVSHLSNAGNLRNTVLSMDRNTLIECYNRIINENNLNNNQKISGRDYMASISRDQIHYNLKTIVLNFVNGIKNNISLYNVLVNINSSQKSIPSIELYKNFINRFSSYNYHVEDQDIYFRHIHSKGFNLEDIQHRLYINSEYNDTYKFLELFAERCEQRGLKFYFKTALMDFNTNEIAPPGALTRTESAVIYASDDMIAQYTEICREIRNEHPEINFYSPPIATASIDGWLGYGMEPNQDLLIKKFNRRFSFNSLRTMVIEQSINRGIIEYINARGNFVCSNGWTINDLYIYQLYEHISSRYNINAQNLYNHLFQYKDYYVNMMLNGQGFRIGNFDVYESDISRVNIDIFANYLRDIQELYDFIGKSIAIISPHYGIDPNNFSLNI